MVDLPGGYRTSRRDLFKFLSLGGGLGSLYVTITRAKVGEQVVRTHTHTHTHTRTKKERIRGDDYPETNST